MKGSNRALVLAFALTATALTAGCFPPPWHERHERRDDRRGDRHERHDDNRNDRNERHDNNRNDRHERHDDNRNERHERH
jgi:hypothetical protein